MTQRQITKTTAITRTVTQVRVDEPKEAEQVYHIVPFETAVSITKLSLGLSSLMISVLFAAIAGTFPARIGPEHSVLGIFMSHLIGASAVSISILFLLLLIFSIKAGLKAAGTPSGSGGGGESGGGGFDGTGGSQETAPKVAPQPGYQQLAGAAEGGGGPPPSRTVTLVTDPDDAAGGGCPTCWLFAIATAVFIAALIGFYLFRPDGFAQIPVWR